MFGGQLKLGCLQCLALLVTVWLFCQALFMTGDHQTYGVKAQKLMGTEVPKSDEHSPRKNKAVFDYLSEDNITRDCITWRPVPAKSSRSAKALRPDLVKTVFNETESDQHRSKSFSRIWKTNSWGRAAKSGPGSLLKNTLNMRQALGAVVERIKKALNKESVTLLDSSCGDMSWIPTFLENRSDVIFTGYDIVPGNIDGHVEKFRGRPWKFEIHDIVSDPIPKQDIILSRQTLQHLTNGDNLRVLANFLKSGTRFLITTNFPHVKKNTELDMKKQFRFRPINLLLAPYYLPPQICTTVDFPYQTTDIGLWDLRRMRQSKE